MKDQKSSKYEEPKTSIFIKITLVVVALAIIVVAAYSLLSSTGTIKRMTTAYTVGEEKISAMDMTIHYYDVRNNVLSQYGSLLQAYGYTIDSTLDRQTCAFDSTKTWKEYFLESATSQARQIAVLSQEAETAGYVMTDADQQKYDAYISALEKSAEKNDLSVGGYIRAVYGTGAKLSDVERVYKTRFTTAGYYEVKTGESQFTDADIEAYYNENKATYDLADAYYYSFPYTTYTFTEGTEVAEGQPKSAEEATTMSEESKAEAQKNADAALALITSADDFDAAIASVTGNADADTALHTGLTLTATDARTSWLADETRAAGDKTVVDNTTNSSFDVVLYMDRYRDTKQAASVRHILLQIQSAAEGATEEEINAVTEANKQVRADIEALYEEWKAGDATEESFAALARDRSEDTGSNFDGGLYEHFSEGTMETAFNSWSFDPARKAGDTEIIETTYGYHLMYFVSADGDYVPYEIEDTMRSDAYDAWYAEVEPNYTATQSKTGMNLVG